MLKLVLRTYAVARKSRWVFWTLLVLFFIALVVSCLDVLIIKSCSWSTPSPSSWEMLFVELVINLLHSLITYLADGTPCFQCPRILKYVRWRICLFPVAHITLHSPTA